MGIGDAATLEAHGPRGGILPGHAVDADRNARAGDRSRLPAAQEPGEAADVRAAVRKRACVLSRGDRSALHGSAAPGCGSSRVGARTARPSGRGLRIGAVRQRPSVRGIVISQRGDRARVRLCTRRSESRSTGACRQQPTEGGLGQHRRPTSRPPRPRCRAPAVRPRARNV